MTQITKAMKLDLEGRGRLTVRPSDYVSAGGEGAVYRSGDIVVKLYADPDKMRRDGMADKIRLLSSLNHPFVVAPRGVALTGAGEPVGYYMDYVDGEPLPRLFTNDFRGRTGFGDGDASLLVDRMRQAMQFAHANGAVMVDPNEMNWLADLGGRDGPQPRVIDVDSWAIGRWSGSVVMLSIRDWQASAFSEATDWFAWGIVTFQIYTGIHPYKGKLAGYGAAELERRMRDNASVFEPGIRLNRAVRDFSAVPGALLDWYVGVFRDGERTMPPSPFERGGAHKVAAMVPSAAASAAPGELLIEKLFGDSGNPVRRVWPCGVVRLESGTLVDLAGPRVIGSMQSPDGEIVRLEDGWLIADRAAETPIFGFVNATNLQAVPLTLGLQVRQTLRFENRLFTVTDGGLAELKLSNLGRPLLSAGQARGVLPNATRWFDGVGIQDVMGAAYVIAPFGEDEVAQLRVPELDGQTPVNARAGRRFVTVVGIDSAGDYRKTELAINADYRSYRAWQGEAAGPELNIAILPKGVCATIVEDGMLDVFVPANGKVNRVADGRIGTDIVLANWDDRVLLLHDCEVWRLRMS